MAAAFFSAYHICHITNRFYRRMMHEEDERPPNDKSHAYQFSITYNGCDFCLLTPPPPLYLLLSPNAYLKDGVCSFLFFVIAIESVRYCTKMSTIRCETSEIAKLILHSIFHICVYEPRHEVCIMWHFDMNKLRQAWAASC